MPALSRPRKSTVPFFLWRPRTSNKLLNHLKMNIVPRTRERVRVHTTNNHKRVQQFFRLPTATAACWHFTLPRRCPPTYILSSKLPPVPTTSLRGGTALLWSSSAFASGPRARPKPTKPPPPRARPPTPSTKTHPLFLLLLSPHSLSCTAKKGAHKATRCSSPAEGLRLHRPTHTLDNNGFAEVGSIKYPFRIATRWPTIQLWPTCGVTATPSTIVFSKLFV